MIIRANFLLLSALVICCCRAEATVDNSIIESHVGTRAEECRPGWTQYGTRCFKFVPTTRTWAESERYCVMMGGNLASVHSGDEYYFIQELVRIHTHSHPCAWIGGYDATQNGLWLWSDGSRFDYSHWNTGQPDNCRGIEHCAHINFGGSLRWNDIDCLALHSSVCSMDL